jgi:N-acetylmuramoyl-L-alanine amidase
MFYRIAISLAGVAMGISCFAGDVLASCEVKAKKGIIIMLDVGHTTSDSGQISARGVAEYDFNMKLAQRVRDELVNASFSSTQMLVTSLNGRDGRQRRAKRANDLNADLFISLHHDGVEDRTLIPWQYNGKQHGYLDEFRGFSLWVSRQNSNYAESLTFARMLADQLLANGLEFTTHHDESAKTNKKYGRVAPLVDRKRGIYAFDFRVLKETHMPAVLLEAGMIVNRAEEQVLSSPTRRATIARAVTAAVERFCQSPTRPKVAG